jgi:hypothetical protein
MANACRGARPVFTDGVTIKFLFNISRLSLEIADRRRGLVRHRADVTEWIDARHAELPAAPRMLCQTCLGLSNIFGSGIFCCLVARLFFEKLVVNIDEIPAAAIRAVWLHIDGPALLSLYRVEGKTTRRVCAALKRDSVVITEAHQCRRLAE